MTVGSVSAGFLPFLSVTIPLETRVGSDWDAGAFPLTSESECERARGCLKERARVPAWQPQTDTGRHLKLPKKTAQVKSQEA